MEELTASLATKAVLIVMHLAYFTNKSVPSTDKEKIVISVI